MIKFNKTKYEISYSTAFYYSVIKYYRFILANHGMKTLICPTLYTLFFFQSFSTKHEWRTLHTITMATDFNLAITNYLVFSIIFMETNPFIFHVGNVSCKNIFSFIFLRSQSHKPCRVMLQLLHVTCIKLRLREIIDLGNSH